MCGITGSVWQSETLSIDPALLRRMTDAITHRGPDDDGHWIDNHQRDGQGRQYGVALGFRRLSIIDVQGAAQPMPSEDGGVQMVFNGEIYNYQQLRNELLERGHVFRTQSDTEVLAHLYEDHGQEMCRFLRGMFAFAIWDARRQRLLLARDHLGQKPLYIYRDEEKLLFGSELKALFVHPRVSRDLNLTAMEDFLTFGFVPGSQCIFSRAEKLPAAHSLIVEPGGLGSKPKRYWDLSFGVTEKLSDDEWLERVDGAIQDSVRLHLIADVPVGAFLSGGLDSSAIVSTASRLRSEPVQTFSIGFQEKQFSELPYAEAVAKHYGCIHTEEIVTPDAVRDLDDLVYLYDEPFADTSAIPTMAVSRMASRHVKVALSGDGGDELFGGYARYSHDLKEASIRSWLPGWFRRTVLRSAGAVWPRAHWLPRPLRLKSTLQNLAADPAAAYANTVSACRTQMRHWLMTDDLRSEILTYRPEQHIESAFVTGSNDALSGMLAADTRILLPDDFLTKVDRASMGFGLEVRPPLIDWQLMELACQMPSSLKIRNGSRKWVLKQLFESRLPDRLVHRRKQGFEIPVDDWLRGPLRDQVEQVVGTMNSPLADFINPVRVRRLIDEHCRRQGRHGQLLWSLLVLGRWMQQWGRPSGSRSADSIRRARPGRTDPDHRAPPVRQA
ncbi:MAG: asparagine synthase (glutamine-hydrolyzing) [Planctomycetaceae bacterium]|nr:asparagine synthase (glutamine-hydrolyzing) [Planctomycetaceae bacterium]